MSNDRKEIFKQLATDELEALEICLSAGAAKHHPYDISYLMASMLWEVGCVRMDRLVCKGPDYW